MRRLRAGLGASRAVAARALAVALVAAPALLALARDDGPALPKPDVRFYALRVAPWVAAKCASCHGPGAGGLRLGPAAPGESRLDRVTREFEAVAHFVDREAPWRSRLVQKVLPEDQGGLPHGGGALLTTNDEAYDDLLDFASGATLENLPPEPEPGRDRRVKPGTEVVLDGSLSYDRDQDRLQFRWELLVRPPGSKVALTNEREAVVKFTPDVGGTYVARLRVSDGKVWSAPKPVVLEALDRVGPEAPDSVAPSGLSKADPAALRAVRAVYGAVLGRPPTPPEALAGAGKAPVEIGAVLLATLEAGRGWTEDAVFRLGLVGDFVPTSDAATSLPLRLASGTLSPADAEAALARDPAFLRAHPDAAALARVVSTALLGRDLTAAEGEALASAAAGKPATLFGRPATAGAAAVVEAVLAGDEFRAAARRRFLARYEAPGADAPADAAGPGTTALALSCLRSPAFAAASASPRRADDLGFVRAVFADLLGRRPTEVELPALARAAAVLPGSTAGRAAIVAVLLDSGEVALPLLTNIPDLDAWVADRFLRYVGRPPAAAEAVAYRAALVDPDGGPQTVLRALLGSEEYASR